MPKIWSTVWSVAGAIFIITPLSFMYTNCSQSPVSAAAPAGVTAVTSITQKIVLLRDGYNGYSGTRDTTIYVSGSDWSSYGVVGSAPTAEQVVAAIDSGQTNTQRSFGLISFDVSGLTTDLLQATDSCATNLEVARAQLDVFASPGGTGTFISVGPMLSSAPAWNESTATYINANGSAPWPTSPNANQVVLNSARLGYFDSFEGVANNAIFRHLSFDIPTDSVKSWICDSTNNKGLLWRVMGSGTSRASFFSREFPDTTYRPLLTLWLRRI